MKIKDKGKKIVLEENDCIEVELGGEFGKITLENINNSIKISGDCEIIKSINGRELLERIHFSEKPTTEELINKCDKWLDLFKKTHDVFKEIISEGKYKEKGIHMDMYFTLRNSFSSKNKYKGMEISLTNKNYNTLADGPKILVSDENMYEYLLVNAINYIFESDFKKNKIEVNLPSEKDDKWNGMLPLSSTISSKSQTIVISLPDWQDNNLIMELMHLHDSGISAKPLIEKIKDSIKNKNDDEMFNKYFNITKENYKSLTSSKQKKLNRQ